MSNRIDQLFKNKLSEHVFPPSDEAWTKVQNGLSKKNNVVIYWRAAAVFVLFGLLVSAWYLFRLPVEISTQQIAKKENTEIQDKPAQTKEDERESANTYATKKETSDTHTQKPRAKSIKSNIIDKKEELTEKTEPSAQIDVAEIGQTMTVAEVAVEKPIVLEFTLPTIEDNTPVDVALADAETEKSTGIKKFLETARDVKNGDAEFANSLRDIKNELFALEFKKDKTRRN